MPKKARTTKQACPQHCYRAPDVSTAAIRRYARQVAERFAPERIILFGSHAYGRHHADSDVDILVVMPARNQHDQAVKIRLALSAPFPMDLLVRTPKEFHWRLPEGESFLKEIVSRGKVLYEKRNRRVVAIGRSRHGHGDSHSSPRARTA
jgi:predicted nucleotidyltransferase